MSDGWPDDDVLLMLVRESQEHKRAWALVAGLSKTILTERKVRPQRQPKELQGKRPETWEDRMQSLERRIVKQRKALETMEECRKFEAETEGMLTEALVDIANTRNHSDAVVLAETMLNKYRQRLGPRSANEEKE